MSAVDPLLEVIWPGGSLDLLGWTETAYGDVRVESLASGTEWGNAETVHRELRRLAYGSTLTTDHIGNRTVTLKLRLKGTNSAALSAVEATLDRLSSQRGVEVHWSAPQADAAAVAFIAAPGVRDGRPFSGAVVTRDYPDGWDLEENRLVRFFTLTATCLPYVRSIDSVVIEALPALISAPTVLDDCTDATGWAATSSAVTLTVASGGVELVRNPGFTGSYYLDIPIPFAITERYLAIEMTGHPEWVSADAGYSMIEQAGMEANWRFYDISDITAPITSLRLRMIWVGGTEKILTIGESATPALTAGRQALRVIATPGSAPADGSVVIESRNALEDGSGDTIDEVIVYTGSGYDPRMSPYSDSARVADTDALSGTRSGATNAWMFTRPSGSIPNGSYSVWVRAKGTASETAGWGAIFGGAAPGVDDYLTVTGIDAEHTFDGTDYNLFRLGTLDLPGLDVGVLSGLDLRVYMSKSGDPADLDEMLLFNRTTGRLIIVDTSDVDRLQETAGVWSVTPNGGATRVWIDAASTDGSDKILAGAPAKDMSLPVHQTLQIRAYDGPPEFTPDLTYVYVATTGTIDPKVSAEFRPAAANSLPE